MSGIQSNAVVASETGEWRMLLRQLYIQSRSLVKQKCSLYPRGPTVPISICV